LNYVRPYKTNAASFKGNFKEWLGFVSSDAA